MGLERLELRQFRLFEHLELEPDIHAVTVLLSPNGTGKTSVLEAVYALATASSFRTSAAVDMVRNGTDLAEAHGVITQNDRRIQVDLTLTRHQSRVTKKMLVNGQRPRSRADLAEVLPVTVFTPEGVDMVRHGPDGRRQFLTTLMTDVDLRTGELIERFERTLRQRNALIRSFDGVTPTHEQLVEFEAWTRDFVAVSEELIGEREALLHLLTPIVEEKYRQLSRSDAKVVVRYERSFTGDLATALRHSALEERQRGYSVVGPHRDDLALVIDDRDARRQASQGEQRSLALALRLAGHDLVQLQRSVNPLLLLDDVFSELDPMRSEALLTLLPQGQTLVTTASPLPRGMDPAVVISLEGRT